MNKNKLHINSKWETGLVVVFSILCLMQYAHAEDSAYSIQLPSFDGSDGAGIVDTGTVLPDQFTGALNYSIPIKVPAGRNGVQPDLALTYRSNRGNGWVGAGWDLEIAAIERSTRKGVDYTKDDYILRMKGATIELVNIGPDEYREKIEHAFYKIRKITSTDGRPSWEVTDKKGVRHLFGRTADSRQDDPQDSSKIFKWCLDRVEDTNGNFMTLRYWKFISNVYSGYIYPDRIEYTGNSNTGKAPSNSINFYWVGRLDEPLLYTMNFESWLNRLLATIEVTANSKVVRAYVLGYQNSSNTRRSLLTSVQQYDKNFTRDANNKVLSGSALPPITLSYVSPGNNFADPTLWLGNSGPSGQTYNAGYQYIGDFNGDGKTDYMYNYNGWYVALSNGNGFDTPTLWLGNSGPSGQTYNAGYQLTGDFNGDGKTDYMYNYNGWYVALSNGNGFGTPTLWLGNSGPSGQTYNAGYQYIGDFNGDGKTDYMYYYNGWYVALSNGTGFGTPTLWLPDQGIIGPWRGTNAAALNSAYQYARDFNGDGKTDYMYFKYFDDDPAGNRHGWYIALANAGGAGFDAPTLWLNRVGIYGELTYDEDAHYQHVGDFNGDGKTDYMYYSATSFGWHIALSNGKGFRTPLVGPANGAADNKSSAYQYTGDFNGDKKTDYLYYHNADQYYSAGWYVLYSAGTGNGFEMSAPVLSTYGGPNGQLTLNPDPRYMYVGDFNGDGKTDYLYNYNGWHVAQSHEMGDPLSGVDNGLGGFTSITYVPSTRYVNTLLPFPLQTLSSITTCDNYDKATTSCKGNSSTTKYEYSGGFYHISERDFRGFNYAKVTVNAAGPASEQKVTETWFHQGIDTAVDANDPNVPDGYMKGQPYRTRTKDGSANVYSETTISYQPDANAADGYFNPPDTISTFICDGSSTDCNSATSGQSKMTKYSYDGYGNVIQEEVYDSANATSPYRTTKRTFTTDTAANYLVALPKDETIYQGAAASGIIASSSTFYYDDPSDCSSLSRSKNQSPTKGNVTTIARLLKEKPGDAGTYVETNLSYDIVGFGNLVCTRDPKGYVSRIAYDTGTNIYPTIATNAKGQQTTTQYYDGVSTDNGLYGQPMSVIDPNGAVTIMEYDTFGRPTKIKDPYGTTAAYGTRSISYENFGTVNSQKVVTYTTVDYATSAVIWTETYFDGFGRTIKTRAQGPDNKVIATTTTYDTRGAISQSSLPYFEGSATTPSRSFKYDPMGRVTETTNPDGKIVKACYLNGVSSGVKPDGHKKRETKDVFGRLVQVDEYDSVFASCSTDLGTPYATTRYQYDVMGNLRFVFATDPTNLTNPTITTEIFYDTLGRKYKMKDPDMGEWRYSYDANGNLISQTDAKNQTIGFAYDELNRITLKDYPTGTDVTYTYDVTPGGTAATYPIGRLSTMADASGTTKYYYDKLGRPTKTTKTVDNTNYDFTTSYDALGRITGVTYPQPDSETVSYSYNADLLAQVSGAGVNYAAYANYNALGQPGAITYGNGITTNYQYDPTNNRLQSIVTGNTDRTLISLAYTYYDAGSVKDIVNYTDSSRTQSFQYDGLDRLQQAQSSSYGGNGVLWYDYSQIGNIKLKEGVTYDYTGPKPHAVKSTSNGITYAYDDNGNMVSESQGSVVYRKIDYNYDNMPQSVTINNTATTSFVYDGAGARVKKNTSTGSSIYLGKLYECKEGTCTKYIFGGDTRLAMKNGTDVLYYHQDHLGSTLAVSNNRGTQQYPCSSKPVRIAAATPRYFDTIQAAYNAAADGDVIQTRAGTFAENLELNRNISVTLSGGYDCGYAGRLQNAQLVGMLSDNAGTLTIESFDIVITGYAMTKVEDVQYLPFGETRMDAGYLSVTHKYTSQELDAETGLYYYGARYYNPVLGRFISPDTIVPDFRNPQALNRYSYVLNNPLYYNDPTGNYYDMGFDTSFPDYGFGGGGFSSGGYSGGSSGGYSGGYSLPSYSGQYNYGFPSTSSQNFYSGQYEYGLPYYSFSTVQASAPAFLPCNTCRPAIEAPPYDLSKITAYKFFESESVITSPYGIRINPATGQEQFHSGIDIAPVPNSGFGTSLIAPGFVDAIRTTLGGMDIRPLGWPEDAYIHVYHVVPSLDISLLNVRFSSPSIIHLGPGADMASLANIGRLTGAHAHMELHVQGNIYDMRYVLY